MRGAGKLVVPARPVVPSLGTGGRQRGAHRGGPAHTRCPGRPWEVGAEDHTLPAWPAFHLLRGAPSLQIGAILLLTFWDVMEGAEPRASPTVLQSPSG